MADNGPDPNNSAAAAADPNHIVVDGYNFAVPTTQAGVQNDKNWAAAETTYAKCVTADAQAINKALESNPSKNGTMGLMQEETNLEQLAYGANETAKGYTAAAQAGQNIVNTANSPVAATQAATSTPSPTPDPTTQFAGAFSSGVTAPATSSASTPPTVGSDGLATLTTPISASTSTTPTTIGSDGLATAASFSSGVTAPATSSASTPPTVGSDGLATAGSLTAATDSNSSTPTVQSDERVVSAPLTTGTSTGLASGAALASVTSTSAEPSSVAVSVKSGDTLSSIAKAHGVTLSALEAANKSIGNFDLIYPGQTVYLPTSGAANTTAGTGGSTEGGVAGAAKSPTEAANVLGGTTTAASASSPENSFLKKVTTSINPFSGRKK